MPDPSPPISFSSRGDPKRCSEQSPAAAMVLAAGLGTRMRPLTARRPKALVSFLGRPLLAHVLDRLAGAGVMRVIINTHHHADQIAAFVADYDGPLALVLSREEDAPLESGGGVKKARPLLGDAPVFVVNCDSFWRDGPRPALTRLARFWDPAKMDMLWLLAPTVTAIGYRGRGDVFCAPDGRLRFPDERWVTPFAFTGVQILKPNLVATMPGKRFSLTACARRIAEKGRLFGLVHDGFWAHLGDPQALREAAALLKEVLPEGGGAQAVAPVREEA